MTAKRGWWIVIIAAVGITAFLVLKGFSPKDKQPTWQTVSVKRGDIQVSVLATGAVQPQNRVEIRPPVSGRAEDILVREGQTVKKGQILAWLSSTERAVLLDAASAKGAEELAHWKDLYKPTPLMAPLDGVVIARKVEPGQTVTAQDAVLVLSDRLIVKAQVDETDIAQVKTGQEVEISLDAYPHETISGRVVHITYEAKTVNNVTIYEVDVLPGRVPDFMRSGMTSNVKFRVAIRKNTLLLPAEAVHLQENRSTVLVPTPSNEKRPVTKDIETGLSDGSTVEVLAGLQEGDTVLVPIMRLPSPSDRPQGSPFSPFGSGTRQRRGGG
jgi:macrolide-specific efflux system membrane fusion protein